MDSLEFFFLILFVQIYMIQFDTIFVQLSTWAAFKISSVLFKVYPHERLRILFILCELRKNTTELHTDPFFIQEQKMICNFNYYILIFTANEDHRFIQFTRKMLNSSISSWYHVGQYAAQLRKKTLINIWWHSMQHLMQSASISISARH